MNYAYVRVSTNEQNEKRQVACLNKYGIDKWYSEKASGATMERPKLQEMLKELKSGDTVYISDFSRLARNTYDLLCMIDSFEHYGINLVSDKEKIDMSTASGKLMVTVIAAVNEFERNMMLERQAEAIAVAKEKGTYRHRGDKKIDSELFDKNYSLFVDGNLTKIDFAKNIGVSRPTLDKILRKKAVEEQYN